MHKTRRFIMSITLLLSIISNVYLLHLATYAASESAEETIQETDAASEEETTDVQSDNTPGWPKAPSTEAEAAIVMNASNGSILYEKNIDEQYYPASITKIVTALVVLEHAQMDEIVEFTPEAFVGLPADSSSIGMQAGEQLTVEDCLYAIMLASANEVSNAVAIHVAGSVEAFADLMNEKAASLGCQNTHFSNPHGLDDENHYVSAYDMALLTKAALEIPDFLKFANCEYYTIDETNQVDEKRYLANHHQMLLDNSSYAYEDCIGGKTGFTDNALNTLVTIVQHDDVTLICVILKNNGAYKNYQTTIELFDYCINNFKTLNIAENDSLFYKIGTVEFLSRVMGLSFLPYSLHIDVNASIVVPNSADFSQISRSITLNDEHSFLESKVSYFYNGRFLGELPLIVTSKSAQFTASQSNINIYSLSYYGLPAYQTESMESIYPDTDESSLEETRIQGNNSTTSVSG